MEGILFLDLPYSFRQININLSFSHHSQLLLNQNINNGNMVRILFTKMPAVATSAGPYQIV